MKESKTATVEERVREIVKQRLPDSELSCEEINEVAKQIVKGLSNAGLLIGDRPKDNALIQIVESVYEELNTAMCNYNADKLTEDHKNDRDALITTLSQRHHGICPQGDCVRWRKKKARCYYNNGVCPRDPRIIEFRDDLCELVQKTEEEDVK